MDESARFDSEEPTQPIAYVTLAETAAAWRAAIAATESERYADEAVTTRLARVS